MYLDEPHSQDKDNQNSNKGPQQDIQDYMNPKVKVLRASRTDRRCSSPCIRGNAFLEDRGHSREGLLVQSQYDKV